MRAIFATAAAMGLSSGFASAQERFVERTPLPRTHTVHTMERAGNPSGVSPHATPSVTSRDAAAYIGGARLRGNNVFARGAGAVTGPVADGVFGTDYAGVKVRPGRVFLGASANPAAGQPFARGYRTDGPHVPDVFALRPFRKALWERSGKVE